MNHYLLLFLISLIHSQVCPDQTEATILDFDLPTQVNGDPLHKLSCNAQTRIDFTFDQAASGELTVTHASGNYHTFDDSRRSYLEFLNREGKEWRYRLAGMAINPYSEGTARVVLRGVKTTPDYELSVTYSNQEENQDTIISIYILKSNSAVVPGDVSVIAHGQSKNMEINGLYNLIKSYLNASSTGTINNIAGGISYLRNPDLSQFYTVQTQPSGCGKKINFLLSGFTIKLTQNIDFTNITASTSFSYTNNQTQTGNRLCYGSQNDDGVFQTHMRESYPLWTAWFSVLFFWVSILFGQSNTVSVYDKDFENNKWTSWEFYSLWHLANEVFFSRIMRTAAVFGSFWVMCLVSAALYAFIGFEYVSPLSILYFGIAGMLAGFIYSFFSGFFLSGVSQWNYRKYNTKKKIQLLNDKESHQAATFELDIDLCEDRIYIYYYWFYIINLIVIIACWTLSVNFMQMPPREYYYLMYYWVASVGVGTVLYCFVLTPLWALLCGNYAIAQVRGYWYDARIGQIYRELES